MASVPHIDPGYADESALAADRSMEIFRARLEKVASGKAPRHVIWVGANEAYAIPQKRKGAPVRVAGNPLRNALYPITRVAAVALGFAGHGVAQIARYHLVGLPDGKSNPDIEMLVQLIAGFGVAMVLGYVLGLRGREYSSLKSLGAALGVVAFHNLVHQFPHLFETLASPIWVNWVVTQTEPHSLVWRGISFVL